MLLTFCVDAILSRIRLTLSVRRWQQEMKVRVSRRRIPGGIIYMLIILLDVIDLFASGF